jgi:segregation and condensation protein A
MEEVKEEQKKEHPSHRQVYNIVIGSDPSWHTIIYELVTTEQLDPWNIDISVLCRSYFEKIKELEQNNFHISSKMLLAAALLLRIKSEILLNKYIREIDDILFPRNDIIQKMIERIEIDENEIPILSPKTPLPRFKKVTLQELIDALDVAIKTEGRRIQKEIEKKQAERLSHVDIPKFKRINIKERIRHFYAKLLTGFNNKRELKLSYSHFTGNNKEEKIACFLPMLYLSNNGKIWLEQDKHYSEIFLYLYETFIKHFPEHDKHLIDSNEKLEDIPEEMMEKLEEFEEVVEELEKKIEGEIEAEKKDIKTQNIQKINQSFENPLGDLINKESDFSG